MTERESSQFKRVHAAVSGDTNKLKGQYRVPKKRGRPKGSKNASKQVPEVDLTGDDAAETIKEIVNISSDDEDADWGCDGDWMPQFDPDNFRRYPTRIKKSIKKSLPYHSKE